MRRLAVWTVLAAMIAAAPSFADQPKLSPLPPPVETEVPPAATKEVPPAAGTPSPAAPNEQSFDERLKANPSCQAFINDCEICTRSTKGAECSTPGLACQPKAWRCASP